MEKPLVDKECLLEKFPGKGGWTIVQLPEIAPDKKAHFNWVKVRGSIDGYAIENFTLMPMGSGKLFLAVKAEIRKSIGKNAGDRVHLVLFPQNPVNRVREDLLLCLEDEPAALKAFLSFPEAEQKSLEDWIAAAKDEDAKADRIAKTIDKLLLKISRKVNS